MTVALIPYACGLGGPVTGCERGPEVARAGNLRDRLAQDHIPAAWIEGLEPWTNSFIPDLGSAPRLTIIREHLQDVCENVANALNARMLPATIGGDHSLAIGSVSGLAEAEDAHGTIGLLWFDAHLDANTPESSPSQAIYGMPLATLLGHGHPDLLEIGGPQAKLSPEHVCIIGTRSYDDPELELLHKLGVRVIMMAEVRQHGLTRALTEAIEIITKGTTHHYLSFDLDVMDPTVAPAVSVPEENGFLRDDMLKALDYLCQRVDFRGVDFAEYNPKFDKNNMTLDFIGDALSILARRHTGLHIV